jgi:S-adenosylmethionine decarboxylase
VKKLAPNLVRQRLLIEGHYGVEVDEEVIKKFFAFLCERLGLRFYAEPIVFSPAGMGKAGNQGYDAFVPLIDSGISAYFWTQERFLSVVVYTCKAFDETVALEATREFFAMSEVEHMGF